MKIISTLLIASVTIPLCISLTTSSSVDLKQLIPGGNDHASVYLITHSLSSEPSMMLLIGTALIGIAGIGRKRLPKRDNDHKNENQLRSTIPPHPDPVPWKKEE
jgi:hypothetical protein